MKKCLFGPVVGPERHERKSENVEYFADGEVLEIVSHGLDFVYTGGALDFNPECLRILTGYCRPEYPV